MKIVGYEVLMGVDMKRRSSVVRKKPDVSEEHVASIFRMEE
jgi:hypothetical protein